MNTPLSEHLVTAVFDSPIGPLLAGASADGLCLLEFAESARPAAPASHPILDQLREELSEYFVGERRDFTVPLVLGGTPFQRRVWEQLRRIPYGETCSYEDVARAVGDAKAVRAVGSANGKNRIAVVIPCHRVINKGGGLGGYGGGLWRKEFLLALEQRG